MHGYDTNMMEGGHPPPLMNTFDNAYGEMYERNHTDSAESLNTIMESDDSSKF